MGQGTSSSPSWRVIAVTLVAGGQVLLSPPTHRFMCSEVTLGTVRESTAGCSAVWRHRGTSTQLDSGDLAICLGAGRVPGEPGASLGSEDEEGTWCGP